MTLQNKTYKGDAGSVRIYAGDKKNKIGIYVERKSPDYSLTQINAGAYIDITPKKAREVAARLIEWADAIES